jgi:uncharacterized membrane protein
MNLDAVREQTMSAHSALASVTLVLAGVTALSALAYAWVRPVRRVARWPLLLISTAAVVLAAITGEAGGSLLSTVEASASAAEIAAAQAHAHGTDAFVLSVFGLLVTVLATIWRALRPNREHWSVGMWTSALVLTAFAVATLATGGLVLAAALDAVALRNAV